MDGYELATRTSALPSGPWMCISCPARYDQTIVRGSHAHLDPCLVEGGGGRHLAVGPDDAHPLGAGDPRVDEVQELDHVAEELLAARARPSR